MAEEIRNEEVLNEDELEEVAGGYGDQIKADKRKFYQMGILDSPDASDKEMVRAFRSFGVKVDFYHGDWTGNEYTFNGKTTKDRNKVWNYIYSRAGGGGRR